MKALIQKDFYVIWKQMRIFVVIILLLSIMNSAFNIVFLVVWCSMLPYTAMAYDERSHWNQLAAMMPYSRRDVVLSKYVLGWLCMAAASILCLAARVVLGHFLENEVDTSIVLTSLCLGVISLDIRLPAAVVLTAVSIPLSMKLYQVN